MMNTIHSDISSATDWPATDWHDNAFDLLRGIAAYTSSPLMAGMAQVVAHHPQADLANAFNHKQVASKIWGRQSLFETLGGKFGRIAILGGWYGVLAAMFLDDPRFEIGAIDSYDIDPAVGAVAETLNRAWKDRFHAVTADMYALPYASLGADLIINTSCEHIADLPGWLALLPRGTQVLLQSNDYFSEPTHINCVPTLAAFVEQVNLAEVSFAGALPTKHYTRFMVIGRV
jgi:hypothetical protein